MIRKAPDTDATMCFSWMLSDIRSFLLMRTSICRWDPYEGYTGIASNQSAITHGTFFWHASREGCISKGTSVHGGLRTKLFVSTQADETFLESLFLIEKQIKSSKDYEIDQDVGFTLIEAQEIDEIGMDGVISKVRATVGDTPTYLSIDIDGKIRPSIGKAT